MTLVVCNDYEAMSQKAAALAAEAIPKDRESLISFPGGDSPRGFVRYFTGMVNNGLVDISRTRYVSLDEWAGLGPETAGSCAWFNQTCLLNKLQKPFLETFIINGKAADLSEECRRLDSFIALHGPLDLSVLGIGLNGHLGFNEDGVDFTLNAHVIPLSKTTKEVMGKYFEREYPLEAGITQGLAQITAARRIILLASGTKKAAILERAFHGAVDRAVPASILQTIPNVFVVADREAASGLN
ncbi:MAG: glucosamine-6-phosphate deaminase [Treponema sp.]|jgi:glucosamine-6-phosphate deaminase|nr:glucosamine-6-phosphate deaminase [Treponema sp.]